MSKHEQISAAQARNFVISTVLATSILFVPGITAQKAAQDAWLSMIVALFFGVLVAYLSASLSMKFPDRTLVQFAETLLGKIPGKIIGLIFILYCFYASYFVLRQFGELITSVFMEKTPMSIIIGLLTLLSCYVIYSGLEVLARVNDTIVTWLMLSILLIIALIAKDIRLENFLPVLDSGLKPVILGSFSPASWFGECAIIMMLVPFIKEKKKVIKVNILAIILLFISLEIVIIGAIGVMGANFTMRSIFPTFSLVGEINIEKVPIVQRQEALFMVAWVAGMLMKLTTFFYVGVLGLSQWLGMRDYRPLIFPSGIIITSLAMLSWNNVIQLLNFSEQTFAPSITFVNLVLPLSLWAVALARKF